MEYTPASAGQRFANMLIATVIYYVLVFVLVFSVLFTTRSQELAEEAQSNLGMQYLISFSVYFLTELGFKGRTIGKFITGTRVIKVSGENITAKDAALRSLVRFVPFEPFSFLGGGASGWHDKWTSTAVIKVPK